MAEALFGKNKMGDAPLNSDSVDITAREKISNSTDHISDSSRNSSPKSTEHHHPTPPTTHSLSNWQYSEGISDNEHSSDNQDSGRVRDDSDNQLLNEVLNSRVNNHDNSPLINTAPYPISSHLDDHERDDPRLPPPRRRRNSIRPTETT